MHSLAMLAREVAFVIKEAEVNLFFGFLYFFRKSMFLYAIPNSRCGTITIFKWSSIENVNISEKESCRIIALITKLVEENESR